MLPYEWADDDAWKDGVMRPRSPGAQHDDSRVERDDAPQYQTESDRVVGGSRACERRMCDVRVARRPEGLSRAFHHLNPYRFQYQKNGTMAVAASVTSR